MSLNSVQLIGRVGQKPDVRSFENGGQVASFSIATTERWKGKDGKRQERTEWHNVAVFSEGLIKVIQGYVHKGDQIYVQGQLRTRKWQDKDGQDRYSTEVVLQGFSGQIILLGEKRSGNSGQAQQNPPPPTDDDEDIPF